MKQQRARGFTLIEVLVTLALFSLALLGLVAIQARASQLSISVEDSNRAALLANEMAATMWGSKSVTVPAAVDAWKARVADARVAGLPNGSGSVTVNGNVAEIAISWRAPQEAATASHRYVTQVLIPQPVATP